MREAIIFVLLLLGLAMLPLDPSSETLTKILQEIP